MAQGWYRQYGPSHWARVSNTHSSPSTYWIFIIPSKALRKSWISSFSSKGVIFKFATLAASLRSAIASLIASTRASCCSCINFTCCWCALLWSLLTFFSCSCCSSVYRWASSNLCCCSCWKWVSSVYTTAICSIFSISVSSVSKNTCKLADCETGVPLNCLW